MIHKRSVSREVRDAVRSATRVPVAERADYLRTRCGVDDDSFAMLDGLLGGDLSDANVEEFLVLFADGSVDIPDYEMLRCIGQGGFGQVWLARNRLARHLCALKVVARGQDAELQGVREFMRCGQQCPNLVPIEHVGQVRGRLYYTMPLADSAGVGPVVTVSDYEALTLALYLEHNAPLPDTDTIGIARQLLNGLQVMHRLGRAHCDLKPANVLRIRSNWCLGDHGLVTRVALHSPVGMTPGYSPPDGPAGRGGDLYALGMVLYEALSGHSVSTHAEWIARQKAISRKRIGLSMTDVVARATHPEARHRYRTAAEMLADVESVLHPDPKTQPSKDSDRERTTAAIRRRPWKTRMPRGPLFWTILSLTSVMGGVWLFYSARTSDGSGNMGLPSDLMGVEGAENAQLDGLAPGSRQAQVRQLDEAKRLGLPLEVRSRKSGLAFRFIPSGSFTMGSDRGEQDRMIAQLRRDHGQAQDGTVATITRLIRSEELHSVRLPSGMYVGKFEISRAEWENVMGAPPEALFFRNAPSDSPVESVSWEECQTFLRRLGELEGVAPGTYRLLTEEEWEYACRAGTRTALYNGDLQVVGENNVVGLSQIAWYGGNSSATYDGCYDSSGWKEMELPHECAGVQVRGGKRPNAWGLYDTIGNVWEWCSDVFTWDYKVPDRRRPVPAGAHRVYRGGCWSNGVFDCRAAHRYATDPNSRHNHIGLRVARVLPTKARD
ncbi:MAG: SUMF1/EgtB/PvdO family nonheme iron enzyme [Planctomycetota bacterium]